MCPPTQHEPDEAHLNPALKSGTDTSHDLERSPAPLDTTQAKEGEGEGWPWIWAVVTVACVVITIYLLV